MKKILILLICLLVLPIINALVISPDSQQIELRTGVSKNFYLNVSNPGNIPMYYVTLSAENTDISFIDNNFNLTSNESKQIKGLITTSDGYIKDSIIKIIYYTKTSVVLNPTTETVTIINSGYTPSEITIIKGSTIKWTNLDTITHSITATTLNGEISNGQTFFQLFNTPGIIQYYDKFSNFKGTIVVKNLIGQEYVHDPKTSDTVTLKIVSKKVETNLEVDYLDDNFSIFPGETIEGVISIKNLGTKIAESVTLSAKWFDFNKKNFYIDAKKTSYISFSITPLIFSVSETNKTYVINITIVSNNTLDVVKKIDIFIPYKLNIDVNGTLSGYMNKTFSEDWFISFHNVVCKASPNFEVCKSKIVERIIYKPKPLDVVYNQEDLLRMDKKQMAVYQLIEKSTKDLTSRIDIIEKNSNLVMTNTTQMAIKLDNLIFEQQKSAKNTKSVLIIFFMIIFLAGIAIVVGYYVFKYTQIEKRKRLFR